MQAVLGIVVLIAFAWGISEERRKVRTGEILLGLSVTFLMAALMLKVPFLRHAFDVLNRAVSLLEESTRAGTSFVFGYLGGGPLPFDETHPGSTFVLGLQALPIVLVVHLRFICAASMPAARVCIITSSRVTQEDLPRRRTFVPSRETPCDVY